MKRIFLFFVLLIAASVSSDVLAQKNVDWGRPKYVMSCVMEPKPMVLDTIGMYEYHGDSVVIYHRLDMLRDPKQRDKFSHQGKYTLIVDTTGGTVKKEFKYVGNVEPFRTYKSFDDHGNITAEVLYYADTTLITRFVNTYDTLGRLTEVQQSNGLKKKYRYRHKKIKEQIFQGGRKDMMMVHHYKYEDYSVEKRCVFSDGDGIIYDKQFYRYNDDGKVRKSSYDCGTINNMYLYKANCSFVSESKYDGFNTTTKSEAIIYDWAEDDVEESEEP